MKKSELRKLIRKTIKEEAQLLNELYTMNCGNGWCHCVCNDGGSIGFEATGGMGGRSSNDGKRCRDFCRDAVRPTEPGKGDYVDYSPPNTMRNKKLMRRK